MFPWSPNLGQFPFVHVPLATPPTFHSFFLFFFKTSEPGFVLTKFSRLLKDPSQCVKKPFDITAMSAELIIELKKFWPTFLSEAQWRDAWEEEGSIF
jgi:hypothetical protein